MSNPLEHIPDLIGKHAIAYNGRLYRNSGVMRTNDDGREFFEPHVVGESNTLNRGRGRSLMYEVHFDESAMQNARLYLSLSKYKSPLKVYLGKHTIEKYRDVFMLPNPMCVPVGVARFAASPKAPTQVWWSLVEKNLETRRASTIIIDGFLVSITDVQVVVEELQELGTKMYSFSYVSMNADSKDERAAQTVLITNWDGMVWQVGPNVFATTLEEAKNLRRLLHPNVVDMNRAKNPRRSKADEREGEDEILLVEAQAHVRRYWELIFKVITTQDRHSEVPLRSDERYKIARTMIGTHPPKLQAKIDECLKAALATLE